MQTRLVPFFTEALASHGQKEMDEEANTLTKFFFLGPRKVEVAES